MNALKALKEGVSSLGSSGGIGAEKTKELLNRIMKMEELWHTKKVDKFIIDDNRLFLEFVDLLYKSGPPLRIPLEWLCISTIWLGNYSIDPE